MAQDQAVHDQERNDEDVEILELNDDATVLRDKVFDALAAAGIGSVEVSYTGSGDEGYIDDITARTTDGTLLKLSMVPFVHQRIQDGEPVGVETTTLKKVVEELCWDEIIGNSQWEGFWNDDGGSGSMTFHVAERRITWEHSENVMTTEDYSYEC